VDEVRMRRNLAASHGLVNSQSVLTALLTKGALQREEAYALVQRNAMVAWDEDRPLIELLKADDEVTLHLNADEIDACFDPARYLRNTKAVFERLESL
jgi:adenylosuccinate lyase